MDSPMTSWPASCSRAAATEESTPPDMATTMREGTGVLRAGSGRQPRQRAELFHHCRKQSDHAVHLLRGIAGSKAEANRVVCSSRRQVHRLEHVRRLE